MASKVALGAVRKVLVVDDNLDQVRSTALLLRQRGHTVEYAINGIVALHMAQKFKPDFVLLDLGLPDTHGANLARQLKAIPELKDTRILAITGLDPEKERDRALAAGCEWFLKKPVAPSTLELLIENSGPSTPEPR